MQYKSVYVYIQTWEIEIFNLSRRLEKPESNLEAIDSKSLMNPFRVSFISGQANPVQRTDPIVFHIRMDKLDDIIYTESYRLFLTRRIIK